MEWFEKESFWEETYELMFPDFRFRNAPGQVDGILQAGLLPENGKVLDLCCGPGRHALEFARRNIDVTAVDSSSFLLDKAEETAAAENIKLELVKSDIREFCRPLAYDLALILYNSFGYFENRNYEKKALENVFESLRKGAALLIETPQKEKLLQSVPLAWTRKLADGTSIIEHHKYSPEQHRLHNEWILVRSENSAKRFISHHTVFSKEMLRDLFTEIGFASAEFYGGFDFKPLSRDSKNIIALARK